MGLPIPDLDDRRFQDLVDDAKRMVQQRCPTWTDHNVSDPGVTLIETFAYMVDQLLFRLNRVPDRLYLTFLDFIGVALDPPAAAAADVTFWLSAPRPEPVRVPRGTVAATVRTEQDDAIAFETQTDLSIPPRSLLHTATQARDGEVFVRGQRTGDDEGFECFSTVPEVGDSALFGLDDAAPRCVIALRVTCDVRGIGVNPDVPPLVWEAWDGTTWTACEVERDDTGGLNKPGDVVLHVPPGHQASILARERAGWLRCRVVEPLPGMDAYSATPLVRAVTAFTVGATTHCVHAEVVTDEIVGLSEGVPGQTFPLVRRPVIQDDVPTVEVAAGSGWDTWIEVASFADAGPDDTVFTLDRAAGEIRFGPAVRLPDGTLAQHGAVPPKGAPMRVPRYRTGGGTEGNVAARTIRVLRTSVPFVERTENRRAAVGGVAAETVEQARLRGPLTLRTHDRAVTVDDYELLAHQAAPGVARVRCLAVGDRGPTGGETEGLRLLVVPRAGVDGTGRLAFEDLIPSPEVMTRIVEHLDERRTAGARVVVEPPFYQGVTVVASLQSRRRHAPDVVRDAALHTLHRYFDPITGGPDATGWPFGRPVQAGEVFAVLQQLPGTELVDDVRLFMADPVTGQRGRQSQRIDLDPNALVFSFEHQVRVTPAGG